jgi:ankyrin repeat protein
MMPTWECAVRAGDLAALERELEAGGDIDARDRYGQTALMISATRGDRDLVNWCLEHGAALDHTAKFHLSALMLAIVNGHRDIARLLVAAGADVTVCGSGAPGFAGKTASDLARERGDDELLRLLRPDG